MSRLLRQANRIQTVDRAEIPHRFERPCKLIRHFQLRHDSFGDLPGAGRAAAFVRDETAVGEGAANGIADQRASGQRLGAAVALAQPPSATPSPAGGRAAPAAGLA